jgi:hypothetical protein
MIDDFQQVDDRLARLTRATSPIEPRPGFEARVMLAVRRSAMGDWNVGLWRVGRYALALSALAVVVATFFAVRGEAQDDEQQAVAYGTVDAEW